jgi:hypothetical protein
MKRTTGDNRQQSLLFSVKDPLFGTVSKYSVMQDMVQSRLHYEIILED